MKFSKYLLKTYHVSVLMLLDVEDTQIYNVTSFLCELMKSVLQQLVFKTHVKSLKTCAEKSNVL